LNPGRRGGKPATNRLSYGAAMSGLKKERKETKEMCAVIFASNDVF
jgi:hypothetical protein